MGVKFLLFFIPDLPQKPECLLSPQVFYSAFKGTSFLLEKWRKLFSRYSVWYGKQSLRFTHSEPPLVRDKDKHKSCPHELADQKKKKLRIHFLMTCPWSYSEPLKSGTTNCHLCTCQNPLLSYVKEGPRAALQKPCRHTNVPRLACNGAGLFYLTSRSKYRMRLVSLLSCLAAARSCDGFFFFFFLSANSWCPMKRHKTLPQSRRQPP